MDRLRPIVLEGASIADFIEYVIFQSAAPSTLIVCSSRAAFLEQLRQNHRHESEPGDDEHADIRWQQSPSTTMTGMNLCRFSPTLRILFESRKVRAVFCRDVAQLRAYLTLYKAKVAQQQEQQTPSSSRTPMLAILNLITLHRHTSAFSACGLNRSMSVAVDAAHQTGSRLVLAEMSQIFSPSDDAADPDSSSNADMIDIPTTNPWLEEVSMINVTTKSFGAGERGWVGRTVNIATIAQRWCSFKALSDLDHQLPDDAVE
jgi:hypothetical protein